ncbi:MAG: hypothetical protein ACXWJJ_05450, partial [Ramlibacter sp.]
QRSIRPLAAAFVTAVSLASLSVYADSPQYRSGPTCTDTGITATCTGRVSGLGNGDVQVVVNFPNATATTLCHAPGNNNTAPGQNPAAPVTVTGSQTIRDPKNGNLRFSVTTDVPNAPTAEQAGCPPSSTNGGPSHWTVTIEDVTFGTGTLTVYQRDANGVYQIVISSSVTA